MGRPANTVERMLRDNVDQSGDCWIWTGTIHTNGYGKARMNWRTVLAHRVFYQHYKGAIPEGFQIDHLCRNRACVNPDHLEAVPLRTNILRGIGFAAVNAVKAECKHGHALADDNLYITPDGRRQCRTCLRQANSRNNARIREKRKSLG